MQGGTATDSLGSANIPNHEGEDTDDSDTESVPCVRSVVDNLVEAAVPRAPSLRHVFTNMDEVDVQRIFFPRASVMWSVPRRGPFQNATKMVLEEIMASVEDVRLTRGWKVFLVLPKVLLHRPPG